MAPQSALLLLCCAFLPLVLSTSSHVVIPLSPSVLPGEILYEETIRAPIGSGWLRLFFSELVLPPGTLLVITSLHDGSKQHLDRHVAAQWQASTAYFNGDSVLLQLSFRPHPLLEANPRLHEMAFVNHVGKVNGHVAVEDNEIRMKIREVQAGGRGRVGEGEGRKDVEEEKSICFSPDTRVFSNDTRQGRCKEDSSYYFLFLFEVKKEVKKEGKE